MKGKRIVGWGAGAIGVLLIGGVTYLYFTSGNACRKGPAVGTPMQAVIYCEYGSPAVLKFATLEKPRPGDHEVLVKVHAVSINPLDWHFMEGEPFFIRLFFGLRGPDNNRLGVDYAGTVESVGKQVTRFKPGDEVFGGRDGAFAQFVSVIDDHAIMEKPTNLSFEQAAAVPIAAVTALQGLRDYAHLEAGQTVLINGASGGVGTFAVQIAKSYGATVTGVTSTHNADLVRSLGADAVIDYTHEDYTRTGTQYDVIFDTVGNHDLGENRRALKPKGIYVGIGGGGPNDRALFGPIIRMATYPLLAPFVSQTLTTFEAELKQRDLAVLRDLMQAGKVTPVIDKQFPLKEIPAAMEYVEKGHARGKVIVDVG